MADWFVPFQRLRSLSLASLQGANDASHSHALAVQPIDKSRTKNTDEPSLLKSYQNLTFNSTQALLGAPGAKNVALWVGALPANGPSA